MRRSGQQPSRRRQRAGGGRAVRSPSPRAVRASAVRNARSLASSTRSSQTNFISLRTLSGTSSRSLRLRAGSSTVRDAGAVRRDDFLLDAADRQHEPAQADLARHRDVAAAPCARSAASAAPCRAPRPRSDRPSGSRPPARARGCRSSRTASGSTPSDSACALTRLSAACALSFMTSPSCPVRISLPRARHRASPR